MNTGEKVWRFLTEDFLVDSKREKAERLLRQERFLEAKDFLTKAVEKHSGSWMLQQLLGQAHLQLRDYESAIETLTRARTLEPRKLQAIANLGIAYASAGNVDLALDTYEFALNQAPNNALVLKNYGVILVNAGRPNEGVVLLERAISLVPSSVSIYGLLAHAYAEQDNLEDAIAICREAIRLNPLTYENRINLVRVLWLNGQITEAANELEEVFNSTSSQTDGFQLDALASSFSMLRNYKKADVMWQKFLDTKSPAASDRISLAIWLARNGRFEESKLHSSILLEDSAGTANEMINRGIAFQLLEQYEDALEQYDRAALASPSKKKWSIIHNNKGVAQERAGRFHDALESFQKSMQLDPLSVSPIYGAGSVYFRLDCLDEAEEHFLQALRMWPNYSEALLGLSKVASSRGERHKAIRHLEDALEIDPNYHELHIEQEKLARGA